MFKINDNQTSFLEIKPQQETSKFKTRRDELFNKLWEGLNADRVKAGFKPIDKRRLAVAINSNPFLKSNDELELLLKGENWKRIWWILFPKKK